MTRMTKTERRKAAELEALAKLGVFAPIEDDRVGEQPEPMDTDETDGEDPVAVLVDEADDLPEADEGETPVIRSVVKGAYKAKYAERGEQVRKTKGFSKKAAKRSCSDWLAQQLGVRTLDEKAQLKVPAFEAILNANGVKHDHWNRTTKGWQGRLRMTGRLALQRVVAESGELALPEGEPVKAPASWVAQHQR